MQLPAGIGRRATAVGSNPVVDFLADDSILIVFTVIGVAAALGAIKVKGVSLGPAAALFVGLAVGAVDESLGVAEGLGQLKEVGLVLFTYTVGLASGPMFFAGLMRSGAQVVAVALALIVALAGLCLLVAELLGLSVADRAGLFAGSTTNTPSLQAATEAVTQGDPVVAYSLTYPADSRSPSIWCRVAMRCGAEPSSPTSGSQCWMLPERRWWCSTRPGTVRYSSSPNGSTSS